MSSLNQPLPKSSNTITLTYETIRASNAGKPHCSHVALITHVFEKMWEGSLNYHSADSILP